MRDPTGSKLPLAMACPASFALPWIDEPVGEPAIRGLVIHEYLENASTMGVEAALDWALSEFRPFLQAIDLARLPLGVTPEAAFAYDWRKRTARYLGSGLGRKYPPRESPTEIFLTIDLAGVGPHAVVTKDYKTGRTRYGRPREFAQTLAAARAATLAFERDRAIVGLVYVDSHGEVFDIEDEIDDFQLDAFADDLERAMDELGEARRRVDAGGMPDVRPGPHCTSMYCPAYRACPAKSALVRHMPEHVGEIQRPGYLAPTRLARTWHQIQDVKKIVDLVEQEIHALAFREPILLEDGRVLAPRERIVEKFDGVVTRDVVDALIGPGHGDKAVTVKTSKTAIEEVAKAYRNNLPGGKDADGKRVVLESKNGTGLIDRIHAEIRARGGAETTTSITVAPHKPKELP